MVSNGSVNGFTLVGMQLLVNPLERGALLQRNRHASGNSKGSDSSSIARMCVTHEFNGQIGVVERRTADFGLPEQAGIRIC